MNKVSNIVQGLNEMSPQYVGDIPDRLINHVKKQIQHAHDRGLGKVIGNGGGSTKIYRIDKYVNAPVTTKYKAFYAIDSEGEIVYFSAYRSLQGIKYRGFPKIPTNQVLVWRDKSNPLYRGLPVRMALDCILPLTGSIVTDKEQSMDGANLWQQLAERAIERGYSVWKIDRNKTAKSATKFESVADFYDQRDELYGTSAGFQNYLIGITKE